MLNLLKQKLIAKISKILLHMLIRSCRLNIEGMDLFCNLASKEKCMLILWHNRLALAPFILSQYTPNIHYAALVSGSRDGEILSRIIHSYRNGNTIRVPHLSRYQALQSIIRHVEERKEVVIITPDGPRGPCYEVKPGIAVAALETGAHIISLNWEAKNYWKLRTWDRFRIPKPFTTIRISFDLLGSFDKKPQLSIAEVQAILAESLPKD